MSRQPPSLQDMFGPGVKQHIYTQKELIDTPSHPNHGAALAEARATKDSLLLMLMVLHTGEEATRGNPPRQL